MLEVDDNMKFGPTHEQFLTVMTSNDKKKQKKFTCMHNEVWGQAMTRNMKCRDLEIGPTVEYNTRHTVVLLALRIS